MSTAAQRLQAYIDAEAAVLRGQAVTFAGRTLTRANLAEIRQGISELQVLVQRDTLRAAGRESRYAVADFSSA